MEGAGTWVMLGGLASAGAIGIPVCSVPCSKSPTASPCMHHVSLLSPVVHVSMTAQCNLTQLLLRDEASAAAKGSSNNASKTCLVPFAPVGNYQTRHLLEQLASVLTRYQVRLQIWPSTSF